MQHTLIIRNVLWAYAKALIHLVIPVVSVVVVCTRTFFMPMTAEAQNTDLLGRINHTLTSHDYAKAKQKYTDRRKLTQTLSVVVNEVLQRTSRSRGNT